MAEQVTQTKEAAQEQAAQQMQPMTPQDGHAVLLQGVYVPTLFQKLAEYGRVPQSEDEARIYLNLASRVANLRERHAIKQASTQTGVLQQTAAKLDALMGQQGMATEQDLAHESWIKGAANQYVNDPLVQQAVVAFQSALVGQQAG